MTFQLAGHDLAPEAGFEHIESIHGTRKAQQLHFVETIFDRGVSKLRKFKLFSRKGEQFFMLARGRFFADQSMRFPKQLCFLFSGEPEGTGTNQNDQLLLTGMNAGDEIFKTAVKPVLVAFFNDGVGQFLLQLLDMNKAHVNIIVRDIGKVVTVVYTG